MNHRLITIQSPIRLMSSILIWKSTGDLLLHPNIDGFRQGWLKQFRPWNCFLLISYHTHTHIYFGSILISQNLDRVLSNLSTRPWNCFLLISYQIHTHISVQFWFHKIKLATCQRNILMGKLYMLCGEKLSSKFYSWRKKDKKHVCLDECVSNRSMKR